MKKYIKAEFEARSGLFICSKRGQAN